MALVLGHEAAAPRLHKLVVREQPELAHDSRERRRESRLAHARHAHEHEIEHRLRGYERRVNKGIDQIGDRLEEHMLHPVVVDQPLDGRRQLDAEARKVGRIIDQVVPAAGG